ncbi:CBD9-like protein [Aspergillus sclerotioniger CBS 115572]|uniref:CBD9-like protein n=1 Tax=Aspergillus sclerotioniger CBS 115572 TaxID=1450535 RepID=A0A317V4Q7_9EURO|nr:CBD9-like protein [Aspergillus sclerotioniger CBS 115572]PWY68956.1 CBD9-like protein [Aspergillus sclerotioniger CBS 115572]
MHTSRLLQGLVLTPSLVTANILTYSPPSEPALTYSVTIPDTTTAANSGPIYLQISAPTTLQWASLGQGTQMDSANIFILYAASPTNITLSPRSSMDGGQSEPQYNPLASLTLLPGSGINNGKMTANIRCMNCLSAWPTLSSSNSSSVYTLDPNGTSTAWFWASKSGPPVNNSDPSADLAMHDDKGTMQLDLSLAQFPVSKNVSLDLSYNPF